MSEKQFVHLHVHTDYSALDGASKIGSLVDEVHRLGQPAVAITDHGNAQGAYELWKKATEKGINPIVGQEFYVAPGGSSRHGRERIFFGETRGEDKIERSNDVSGGGAYTHMTMWAETTEGMHNLFKLSSYAFLEGRFGSNHAPRIDDELISQYGKGIIATTGCPSGEIQTRLRLGQWKEAVDYAAKMQDILGKENYFLELMDHGLHIEKIVRDDLLKLSDYLNIPKVATNDTHYTRREDAANHDHMLCIQTGSKIDDEKRFRFDGDGYYIKSAQEMRELFKDFPDACDNTLAIAERCHVDFTEGVDLMPKAEVPEGMTDSEFLEQEVIRLMPQRVKGWNKLPEEKKEEYKKRGIYECSIISQMGFPSYFLVVGDFVQWAKNQGIAVGPGRGSAGGCLVAYIMSITDIDPIKHNLIFERFLNPERVSMPDIDIDFDDKRRGEVIAYVTEKYGEDKVSQIVTFGLIKAKAALKDASRILDNPYALGDILSKKMPEMVMGRTMTLKGVYDPEDVRYPEAQEFRDIVEKGTGAFPAATMKEVVEVARGLEGYIRQTGIHAAGVIMSSKPLMDTIPLMLPKPKPQSKKKKAEEEEGDEIQNIITTVTQFDYPTCETLGLLKMDFLGLRNLTIITDAFEYINKNHGITMTMEDLIHSNLDDKKTYRLLQRGDSLGVFQLDGCLAGNTLVSGRTISSLYDRWVKGDKLSTTLSYNLADGTRKRNKVLNIVQSGIKPVYRLVTESGRIVEATADHRFMTNNGWKKLGEIDVSEDQVIVDTTVKTRIHRECIDCQVWLNSEQNNSNERCYKCSATFHSNPSKPASREAIRRASLETYKNGRVVWNKGLSVETNEIMAETALKVRNTLAGRNLAKEKMSPEEYEAYRERLSKRMSGKNNPMFGKSAPHSKSGFRKDLGHYVRSTWEADYARVLIYLNEPYQYEPKTFTVTLDDGRVVNYTPDFYLPNHDKYIEIKGFMRELDQQKIDATREQHGIVIDLVQESEFAELQFKYKNLLEWECPSIPKESRFESIDSITYVNEQMTYDISMEAPLNNFLANGVMVHNSGMRSLLKSLRPTEFNDISAVLALYRPGPMGVNAHMDYADRKNGRKPVVPIHKELEEPLHDILGETYELVVFQEQIMQIAQTVAGYSLGGADLLRRAMGKKKKEEMDKQYDIFLGGMKKRGYSKEAFESLWNVLLPFADYAFNKSHSDGYALLSYVTAYLKAHYPAEYMAALLTSVSDKPDQTALYLNECRKMGIEVLPPDIRKSKRNYDPQGKQIVFGLGSIRGLGEGTVEGIVETRKTSDYDSIASLLENFPADTLNKKVFDGLIHSGALDGYGFSRRALEKDLIASLPAAKTLREEKEEGSMSLFDAYEVETPDIVINDVPEYTKREKLALERHMLGLYVSDHPLSNMGGVLEQSAQKTIAEIHAGDYTEGETTRIAGVITQVENKTTKKGDPMQIVTVEDMSSEMTVLVFAKTIQSAGYLQRDTICQISGTLRKRDDEDTTMMVSAFSEIEIDEATGKVPFWLKFRAEQLDEESATELQSIFKRYPGDTPVFTSLKSPDGRIVNMRLGNDLLVRKNPAMAQLIMEMFGSTVFGKWNS